MKAKQIIKILMQNGFIKVRQKGSHIRLSKENKHTTVPLHASKDIPIGLLKKIEKDTGVKLR